MAFWKKLLWPFRKIGRWLIRADAGQALMSALIRTIVNDLMNETIPGSKKFDKALRLAAEEAINQGVKVYDRVLRRLIEKEVILANDDPFEEIIKEGLELARSVVVEIDATEWTGDNARRNVAALKLRQKVIQQGKRWLNVPRILHVLIEYAVGVERGDFKLDNA